MSDSLQLLWRGKMPQLKFVLHHVDYSTSHFSSRLQWSDAKTSMIMSAAVTEGDYVSTYHQSMVTRLHDLGKHHSVKTPPFHLSDENKATIDAQAGRRRKLETA